MVENQIKLFQKFRFRIHSLNVQMMLSLWPLILRHSDQIGRYLCGSRSQILNHIRKIRVQILQRDGLICLLCFYSVQSRTHNLLYVDLYRIVATERVLSESGKRLKCNETNCFHPTKVLGYQCKCSACTAN